MSSNDYMTRAFPSHLHESSRLVADILPPDPLTRNRNFFQINFGSDVLIIPERIYSDLSHLRVKSRLSYQEGIILHCLLSRHHDGFQREIALKQIINSPFPWVAPFVLRLLGEYVIEIVKVIEGSLPLLDCGTYGCLLRSNESFYELTKQRVVSYWDCYYRQAYPRKIEYPGFKIIAFLDELASETALS